MVLSSIQFVSDCLLFRLLKTTPLNDSIAIKTVSYDIRVKIFFIAERWYSRQIGYHRQTLPHRILIRNSKKKWKWKKKNPPALPSYSLSYWPGPGPTRRKNEPSGSNPVPKICSGFKPTNPRPISRKKWKNPEPGAQNSIDFEKPGIQRKKMTNF